MSFMKIDRSDTKCIEARSSIWLKKVNLDKLKTSRSTNLDDLILEPIESGDQPHRIKSEREGFKDTAEYLAEIKPSFGSQMHSINSDSEYK